MNTKYNVIIVGGGAAGFFTAINCAEKNPHYKVAILERGKDVLSKVKISGGGRCNVTHACFEPKELVKFYPRGERELIGPFHQFCTGDTMEWFEKRGVALKIEADNRVFPTTNSSQTIMDCFLNQVKHLKIDVLTNQSVKSLLQFNDFWKIETNIETFKCEKIVITTGSNPKIWELLSGLKHTIIPPVASLFTFNIKNSL
ncbi:aminoacetone oxidase family FAD-binding enzyme, partial [Flavobacterium sp.]|uniref:aminoacetone oxidase family FAD-binding enzyme n=1 Tax=Flavobacterium sp. TaxID=239 RepID=UPI0035284282